MDQIKDYNISFGFKNEFIVCYNEKKPNSTNYWQTVNPLMKRLPIFMLQISVLIALTQLLMLIFKPLRQPRFIPEILVCIYIIVFKFLFCNSGLMYI